MSHQITKVDLIPNGELSVCNVSQFDNGRVLPFEILENKEAYNIPNDIRVELHCRKPDGNIVTLPSDSITDNIVTFLSTTQLTACYGKNICEIALYGPDDYLIGSGNFILEVEKSPTLGGINSTSAIHDLEDQIRDIAEDVIPEILPDYLEDYYTKSEVDTLIDNMFPTLTASGAIANFTTALTKPLVSVTAAAGATTVTACGVNLWDEDWEVGAINISTGVEYNGNNQLRSKNFCPIVPNKDYYLYSSKTDGESQNRYYIAVVFYDENKNYISFAYANRLTFTTPSGAKYFRITTNSSTVIYGQTYNNDISINYPATDRNYHTYTGNTVPVAEATTLVTSSGVNNVFADVGDVTVGYKYMPMPETPNNSNRLLLSSVNSDIIKEKSEIKEQSDIIEDIERGEENE